MSSEKSGPIIELSTVYFYTGSVPRTLALKDCGLEMCQPMPGLICGIYGRQSKQDGFMAAHAYAERNRLEFTVIDFLVRLNCPINPSKMKTENVPDHDFLSLNQMRRQLWEPITFAIEDESEQDGARSNEEVDGKMLLLDSPSLISRFADTPEYQHLRVVAFDSRPVMCTQTLTIGVVPHRHWSAIEMATCRLNPTTHVTLENPLDNQSPNVKASDQSLPRPRSRR
ncbi:MAG: hypothetical protein V4724_02890 [Pseudomonadota bacterium]